MTQVGHKRGAIGFNDFSFEVDMNELFVVSKIFACLTKSSALDIDLGEHYRMRIVKGFTKLGYILSCRFFATFLI